MLDLTEVPPGWHDLVRNMRADLPPCVEVRHVKSKFAKLAVVLSGPTPDAVADGYHIAAKWTDASMRTCEECGAAGWLREGGWIRTLCDACEKVTRAARRASDG
jgi:hypothetical protein